jgi:hypothetical protein
LGDRRCCLCPHLLTGAEQPATISAMTTKFLPVPAGVSALQCAAAYLLDCDADPTLIVTTDDRWAGGACCPDESHAALAVEISAALLAEGVGWPVGCLPAWANLARAAQTAL